MICSPASPVSEDRLAAGIAALAQRYDVRVSPNALARSGYLAGGDDSRADELNAAFRDPDIRAVILSRGGYGLSRILDRLDADALRRDPKVVVGYSDATALLAWAITRAGVRGIHGPMAAHFGELPAADRDWLMQMMESTVPVGPVPDRAVPIGARGEGIVAGPLVGGNLCMLSHLVGTPYQIPTDGVVLFTEEVGERPYAIDRFLTHLHMAGALAGTRAVVVGELVRCIEKVWPADPDAAAVMDERLRAFDLPGLGALPMGHGDRNFAFPYGGLCEVDFDRVELRLIEAAVA